MNVNSPSLSTASGLDIQCPFSHERGADSDELRDCEVRVDNEVILDG